MTVVALDKIEMREHTRSDLVRIYSLMLIEHRKPPPIKLIKQDNERYPYFIYDGHHRCASMLAVGRKAIKAEIIEAPGVVEK